MASGGAETRATLARMTRAAPVISSTVSPRTRSAIRKPPIWDGVASPDMMASNASAASSSVKGVPAATFWIWVFRSAMGVSNNERAP